MSQDAQLFSLPFLKPWWRKAKQVLLRLFEANTVDRLRRRLHILSQCDIPHLNRDPFGNLCTYLEDSIPLADQIHFLEKVFPTILYLVLNLEDHPEEWSALTCLMRNRGTEVIVRRLTIASLLSTSFLCLLPQQSLSHQEIPYNFEPLYLNLHTETAREKLKCFINYFDVLSEQIPNNSYLGAVKITRRVLPGWCALHTDALEESNRALSSLKVCRNSKLEEFPNDVLKIGQISRVLGHHVWEPNCTPEDVLVCRSPEILGCSFLCEALADSEALEFSGCSAFSQTKGVSSSFEFVAPVTPHTNMNYSHLCAIDAIDFQGIPIESQFTEECVLREINKCYIGLLPQSKLPQRKVKMNALARYASKLSSSIFKEAKFQAQTLQFRQKTLNRRKVAEDFADTIMDTLVKDLPVALKQRVPIGAGSSHNTSPKEGSYLNYLEGVTLTVTPPDDRKSRIDTLEAEESHERAVSLKALEEFSDLFVSNLLRLVTDQLFPKATSKKFISKHRRRGSSRSNSLTQSFSLYDIVYSEGDTTGILKPTALGLREEQNSNFFLGDIEETSADFVTDTSDWSCRGSGKYKSKLPLSNTLAAETFFRGRKFASIREQFSNVLATQILAEAIASYINTLAKKNSSTESSSSPPLESSLSDETRRGSNISSVGEYACYLSDKIVFDAYQTICGKLVAGECVDTRCGALEDDLYSLHSQQTNYSRSRRGSTATRRSISRRRSSNVSVVSSQTINERLYSFFVVALFFRVWSLILMVTQSFSSHYDNKKNEESAPSAIPLDAAVEGDRSNSKRNSVDSCQDILAEHGFTSRLSSVALEKSNGMNKDKPPKLLNDIGDRQNMQKCQKPLIIDTKSFNSFSSTAGSVDNELLDDGRRDLTTISTQTFGCTSFGGDSQFKLFILWIAASMAGVDSVLFHPYGDSKLLEVEKMIHLVVSNGLTVADLFSLLLKYCNYIDLFKSYDSNTEPKPFFTFVENLYS